MPKKSRKCDGKVAYPTLQAAQAAAAGMCRAKAKRGNVVATILRAYSCSCGKFHYGNTKQIDWSKVK